MHDPDTFQPPDAIPLAGVIGWPVAHSRSPALHSHWLRRYGIAGAYVPLAVLPEHLGQVLHTLPKAGFVGVNVTIPHKEAVLALADIVTDRAALIGAANTLIFRPDGRLHADNTDGYGFMANLRQHMLMFLPIASAVSDRIETLENARALPQRLHTLLDDMAGWLASGTTERAEAERDALQGQLNDLRNGWAKSVKAHAALLAERDAAFAAGLEAAAEAVLYLCRMKGMGNRTIDGPEAAHLIRALPIKLRP